MITLRSQMIHPDLESLRCFLAAASHLNFRRAAQSVALSPAAFGERIRRLEEDLEVQLFHRTTRRVTLTDAGVRLRPQAERCIGEAERCASVVTDEGGAHRHVIRIGTRYELGLSWLVPALTELERARPERLLHLCFGDTPELLPKVHGEELD